MSRTLSFLAAFFFVLPAASPAQEIASNSSGNEKTETAVEKKAFDLLETLADQVTNLHSPANQVRAECMIANLLWDRDEKRARALFKAATEQMVAVIANLDLSDQQAYQETAWINQQRQEIITRIANRDPELALSFLRQTRFQPASESRSGWHGMSETNLELQLANLIVAKDPVRALSIAQASLSQGVSWNLIGFLSQLQQKDPKSAQDLYSEIVARIKSEDLGRNQEATNIAVSLLGSFQPPQANVDTYQDLMTTLINAALTMSPGNQFSTNLNNQMNSLMSQVDKYAPVRASELREWLRNVENAADPNTKMYQELNRVSQNGSVDDILALASKYPAELRSQIYQNAAWKAFSNGDVSRARQIVNDFVSEPVQRRQMLEQFDNQSVYSAQGEGGIEQARRVISKTKSVDRKVQLLIQFANTLSGKGDKKGALELLGEAKGLVNISPQNSTQMLAQIQLAQAYSSLDLDQSFELLQPLIIKSNELIAAATVMDGFDQRYLKDGEWIMPGGNVLANIVNNISYSLAKLSHADFGRSVSLSDQFERPELRLMCQLGIAEATLGQRFAKFPVQGPRVWMIHK